MNMSGLVPSYDQSSRTTTMPPTSRAFQTTHLDLTMPIFQSNAITTSVPYQSGAFAFDSLAVNPYNMQQAFNVNYPATLSHAATYPGSNDLQSGLPAVREARNSFPMMERSPPVKAEANSPVQPSQIFNDPNYPEDYKQSSSGESDSGIIFSTDVDTLMKAIQAKSKPAQQRQQQPSKVLPQQQPIVGYKAPVAHETVKASSDTPENTKGSQKSKKRYQCNMPDCYKSFYQKTHLEIHTRAHTGVKPFVSQSKPSAQDENG